MSLEKADEALGQEYIFPTWGTKLFAVVQTWLTRFWSKGPEFASLTLDNSPSPTLFVCSNHTFWRQWWIASLWFLLRGPVVWHILQCGSS